MEAQLLIAQVEARVPRQWKQQKPKRKVRPVATAFLNNRFLERFRGIDRELDARISELKDELLWLEGMKKALLGLNDLHEGAESSGARKAELYHTGGELAAPVFAWW